MIKLIFKYDDKNFYIAPVEIQINDKDEELEIPDNHTEVRPPDGLYKPFFNGNNWVEGITQEELKNLLEKSSKKSNSTQDQIDELKKELEELKNIVERL